MSHTRTVHFPPGRTPREEPTIANDSSSPATEAEPSHPLNLFGTLRAEQLRIKQHTLRLPDSGHHLKTELHILRGSLKRAIEATDQLIAGMEES